jgi:internalin A
MYELLTGQMPPEPTERWQIDTLKSPRQLEPSISSLTEQILLKGLKIRANERFQTASELIHALQSRFGFPDLHSLRIQQSTPPWALERIREAKEKDLEILDLRYQKTALLKTIQNFRGRTRRIVGRLLTTKLTDFSPNSTVLSQLSSSRWLGAMDESSSIIPLTSIPAEVFDLTNLKTLLLSFNSIYEISDPIFQLENLSHLDLSYNQLHDFPEVTKDQKKLQYLNLSGNKLSDLPATIIKFSSLRDLNLSQNNFERIPEPVYKMISLISISFSSKIDPNASSFFSSINSTFDCTACGCSNPSDSEFCGACGQDSEFCRFNTITEISSDIVDLVNLSTLNLDSNPVNEPPPEITQLGFQAIRRYFLQLRSEGEGRLCEAKLLIVGEAGAGKTSLAKKIINSNYSLSPCEGSTEGIDVSQKVFSLEADFFRVNVWDFGGQEIYHATHQFFLTKRSVYVLVADTRKEDTDFYYWLNVAALLSDNSPLLILQNEKQDRKRDINEPILRSQFSNFKETLSTNLSNNRGLEQAIESIKHYIKKLPHFGTIIPKTWVEVRKTIEHDRRNYISLEEYLIICEQHGFTQREDKLQLSQYLHDIGVFLHFQDDDLLNKILILDPNWGTDAVYRVLDNEIVKENRGQFTRSDITQIWSDKTYASMQGELLRLMCKFQLCYEISTRPGTYIAPQLLSEKQPEYSWDNTSNLVLRYTYEFMPKGILTRFIVALHELIHEQLYVWKSGVILSKDDTKAEVIEYYSKREIKLRISGTHRRDLMTIVVHELDKIHDSYKHLKFQKLIPCSCSKCNESQIPHFYDFKKLRERKAHNKSTIECGNPPYLEVNVENLIEGVMPIKEVSSHARQRRHEEINSLQITYDVLSEKLKRLRLDWARQNGSATSFQLEKEIEQAEIDCAKIKEQLQELET